MSGCWTRDPYEMKRLGLWARYGRYIASCLGHTDVYSSIAVYVWENVRRMES